MSDSRNESLERDPPCGTAILPSASSSELDFIRLGALVGCDDFERYFVPWIEGFEPSANDRRMMNENILP